MIDSFAYSVDFDRIGTRIDFVAYNPERIKFFNKLKRKQGKPLETCSEIIEETIEPKQMPETHFFYLGLENIESDTGKAHFQDQFGKEIFSKAKVFRKGNIIFARLRPYLNKAHLVEIDNGIGSTELYVLKLNDVVFRKYLLRYLLSNLTLEQTKWALTGSSLPRLAETDFRNLLIVVPENFKKIEIKMEIFDSQIDATQRAINLKFDEIYSLFIKEYGVAPHDTKINYFIVDSETINKRLDFVWYNPKILSIIHALERNGAIKLGDIVEPEIDYGVNDYGREDGKIPFINIENLNSDGRIHSEDIRYVENCNETKLVKEGDILISRSRGAGIAGLVTEREAGFTFGSYVLRMRIKHDLNIDPLYVVYYMNSIFGQIQVRHLETGSTGCNINPEQLRNIKIIVKEHDVKDVTERIKPHLKEIEKLENYMDGQIKESKKEFEKLVMA